MKILRIILKILLLPVTLALTFLVTVARFLTRLSGGVLFLAAFACFMVGVGSIIFLKEPITRVWRPFFAAWLICPFGLPFLAGFLVELLDVANGALNRI